MRKISIEYIESPKAKVAVAVAAGALVVGGMIGLNQKSNEGVRNHYDKVEQAAINEVDSAINAVFAVRSGAKYRTAPKMGGNEEDGAPTTLAGQVPDGQVLVIDRPIEYIDDAGDKWAGFELTNKPSDGGSTDTAKLMWINVSQLNSPSNGERYIEEFNYSTKGSPIEVASISLNIDSHGSFQGSEMKSGYPIGVGQIIDDAVFTQRVQSENLSLAG